MGVRLHVCPLWSLSVEDLIPWRRLYLATSAAQIRAWSPRCAVSSSVFVTSKPSLCGFRKRTTRLPRRQLSRRACSFWTASQSSPSPYGLAGSVATGHTTERIRDASWRPSSLLWAIFHNCPCTSRFTECHRIRTWFLTDGCILVFTAPRHVAREMSMQVGLSGYDCAKGRRCQEMI